MVICGLDASTSCTGWSIFDNDELIAYGAIKPKGDDWHDRVMGLTMELSKIFRQYQPTIIYAEEVPLKKGASTIEKLGAVQGVILALCAGFKIKPCFLMPSKWRGDLNLFDGTRAGLQRDVLKKKAIEMANEEFGLELAWVAPSSKKNEDDCAEGILIAYSQIKKKGSVMNG